MQKSPFYRFVYPHIKEYPKVAFTEQEMEKVKIWAEDKSFFKKFLRETSHIVDGKNELTRNITGQLGEWAVEKYIGIPFVDWTIGDSVSFCHPDLKSLKVGVKTVEWGKMPVIHKTSYYPEIICIRKNNEVYIAGLATVESLNSYQSQSYLIDKNLRKRNAKTCFYGFSRLKPISEVHEILTH